MRGENTRICQTVYCGFIYRVYRQGDFGGLWEETELSGARHRFGPVGDIQLAIDACRVGFDCTQGYDELIGDLLVGPAPGHELEDFQLAPA